MHFDRRIYVQGAMYRHYIPRGSLVEKFRSRRRTGGFGSTRIDRRGCLGHEGKERESCFLSPFVIRKYYSSEKKSLLQRLPKLLGVRADSIRVDFLQKLKGSLNSSWPLGWLLGQPCRSCKLHRRMIYFCPSSFSYTKWSYFLFRNLGIAIWRNSKNFDNFIDNLKLPY